MKLPRAATRGLRGSVVGDRYQVIRRIGKGGMGAVYELRHKRLGHKFALKTLWSDLAEDPEALGRFRREAEIIAKLRHPHVVEIVDWDVLDDGSPCMVMEYLEGETLAARLERSGRLPWPALARIADQVLSALSLAHSADIVHRDLTPWNVFLASDDAGEVRAKLLDFGISKIRSTRTLSTNDKSVLGTPAYMSPEQADGKHDQVGPASDVWAMGAILFKMATGEDAFSAASVPSTLYRICYQEPESLVEHCPDAPPAFVELVGRTLSRDPEKRITDADGLRAGLRESLDNVAPGAFVEPLRAPAVKLALPLEPGPETGDATPAPGQPDGDPEPAAESAVSAPSGEEPESAVGHDQSRRGRGLWIAGAVLAGVAGLTVLAVGLTGGSSSRGRQEAPAAIATSPDATPDATPVAPQQPAAVTLLLESSPQGAYVYREADGHLLGRTPHREVVEKDSGRAVFRVKLEGHSTKRVEMATDADRTEVIHLERVRVRSKPRVKTQRREKPKPERKKGEPISPPM